MEYSPGFCLMTQFDARKAPAAKIIRSVALWVSSILSPIPAYITVCSPTISPPRIACDPISPCSRSPGNPLLQ